MPRDCNIRCAGIKLPCKQICAAIGDACIYIGKFCKDAYDFITCKENGTTVNRIYNDDLPSKTEVESHVSVTRLHSLTEIRQFVDNEQKNNNAASPSAEPMLYSRYAQQDVAVTQSHRSLSIEPETPPNILVVSTTPPLTPAL